MHWLADTNQLPRPRPGLDTEQEPSQYQTGECRRSKPSHISSPSRFPPPTDGPRRRRPTGLRVPQSRRTALLRHNWDDHEDGGPEPEKRWYERDPPRRWTHDSDRDPPRRWTHDVDLDPPVNPDSQYRRHWPTYHESSPLERHRTARREATREAAETDEPPRWSEDHGQSPRRRMNATSQHHSHWTNEYSQHPRIPRQLDRPNPNRRWAPISQRRLTAIPNLLVRPDIEGSFGRTRRWRADPSHERDAPQVPVNYILPPQSAGYSHQHADYPSVLPQHQVDLSLRQQPAPKVDYEKAYQHPVDYGSVLPQPPVDFSATVPLPQLSGHYGAVLPQQPLDYSALLSQQPMDYSTILPQQTLDYRAALPQPPLDYRTAFPHPVDYAQQMYGWMDYANMMAPRAVNFAVPTADYAAVAPPALQGTDRKGATSAPPNLMWSSQIPHFHANAS